MSRRTFKCSHCRRMRPRNPRVKDQKYCGERACQNARKNKWRKEKLRTDEAYREGVRESQNQWLEKNPNYWKQYRARPERRNESENPHAGQAQRNTSHHAAPIAKSDALDSFFFEDTRKYKIRRVTVNEMVKSDALIVEIIPLSPS